MSTPSTVLPQAENVTCGVWKESACPAPGALLAWVAEQQRFHRPGFSRNGAGPPAAPSCPVWPRGMSGSSPLWVAYPASGFTALWLCRRSWDIYCPSALASKTPEVQNTRQRHCGDRWSEHRRILRHYLGCSTLPCPHSGERTGESCCDCGQVCR